MALARRRDLRTRPFARWDLADSRRVPSLFDEFDQLFEELAGPFHQRGQGGHGYPADLYETGEELVLELAVPGIAADDLDISIEGRQVSIRGVMPEIEDEGRRYWAQGIPRGEFRRLVNLPAQIDSAAVNATVQNGLLVLKMPKLAEAQARKVTVTAE